MTDYGRMQCILNVSGRPYGGMRCIVDAMTRRDEPWWDIYYIVDISGRLYGGMKCVVYVSSQPYGSMRCIVDVGGRLHGGM